MAFRLWRGAGMDHFHPFPRSPGRLKPNGGALARLDRIRTAIDSLWALYSLCGIAKRTLASAALR